MKHSWKTMADGSSRSGPTTPASSVASRSAPTLISDDAALSQLRSWQIDPRAIEYEVRGERRATEGLHGRTCWTHACFEGRIDMLEWLYVRAQAHRTINQVDRYGWRPIQVDTVRTSSPVVTIRGRISPPLTHPSPRPPNSTASEGGT